MQSQCYDTYGTLTGMEGISHVRANLWILRQDHVCTRVDGLVNIRADGFYFAGKKFSMSFARTDLST